MKFDSTFYSAVCQNFKKTKLKKKIDFYAKKNNVGKKIMVNKKNVKSSETYTIFFYICRKRKHLGIRLLKKIYFQFFFSSCSETDANFFLTTLTTSEGGGLHIPNCQKARTPHRGYAPGPRMLLD